MKALALRILTRVASSAARASVVAAIGFALVVGLVVTINADAQGYTRGCGPCNPWVIPSPPYQLRGSNVNNRRLLSIQGVGDGIVGIELVYGTVAVPQGLVSFGDTASGRPYVTATNRAGFNYSVNGEAYATSDYGHRFTMDGFTPTDDTIRVLAMASQTGDFLDFRNTADTASIMGVQVDGDLYWEGDADETYGARGASGHSWNTSTGNAYTWNVNGVTAALLNTTALNMSGAVDANLAGGATIGDASGGQISDYYEGSAVHDFASVAANACNTVNAIQAKAGFGDACTIGYSDSIVAQAVRFDWATSVAGTLTLSACNFTAGALDPPSRTYHYKCFR